MNVKYLNSQGNPVSSLSTFKNSVKSATFGILEIVITDAEGTQHLLKINPNYMGGGFAYFLTHTGMGRGQMNKTTLDDLLKDGGIVDTFVKDAGLTSGGRRTSRKSRKLKRKARKTRKH